MAINDGFTDDINRLIRPNSKRQGLPTRTEAPRIFGGQGRGQPPGVVVTSSFIPTEPRVEMISVWSTIIVLEHVAVETPANWPTTGEYAPGTFPVAPLPLPEELSIVSGTLFLDTKATYYYQKRVHNVYFEQSDGDGNVFLLEDTLYIPLEYPYKAGAYVGYTQHNTLWEPKLFYSVNNTAGTLSDQVSAKLTFLESLGIVAG